MKKRQLLCILLLLIALPVVFSEKHMILLAVEETAEGHKGSTAHLYLKTIEGTGQVFTATYPLTEMDTQISARFAKDIACSYAKNRCEKDFLYTITSESPIVGGPSGGAAITVLTIAELLEDNINEKISITGTINSGGIIGPVGGVKEKIIVAASSRLDTILIPKGNRFTESDENATVDLVEYGKELGIEVIEVSTIDEAYAYFVNKVPLKQDIVPVIDPKYKETMRTLADLLCNRSNELQQGLGGELFEEALNLTKNARVSYEKEQYYSAASHCFGANIKFLQILYQNLTYEEIREKMNELKKEADSFYTPKYESITDLQIFMVVKERLFEANSWLEKTNESLEKAGNNQSYLEDARMQAAYANERLASAKVWSRFFDNKEQKYVFSSEKMKEGCIKKLAEAEERYQYVKIYFPSLVEETYHEITQAKEDMKNGNYELCIFKAAKAKAESDVFLGAMGVTSDYLGQIIEEKLKIVGKILSEQETFPIVAYSYYEYANNLKDENTYSGLLYAEYALELADLDSYVGFEKQEIEKDMQGRIIVAILILLFLAVTIWYFEKK
jgi:uncharacterized protein